MAYSDVLTINQAVKRAKAEGIPVSENALRKWVKSGTLHATFTGTRALIFWPNLLRLLRGE